jgi:hypothetical protein
MNCILHFGFLTLFLLSACTGGVKDDQPSKKDPREELIKTFCGKCPCSHMETDGDDVEADCHPPTEQDEHYGRARI